LRSKFLGAANVTFLRQIDCDQPRLVPASAAVPAAAEQQNNENNDDEKRGVIHL
jgi:hypothetical protein